MPVARYFLYVGGVLLALLFALDAFAPQQAAVASNAAPSIDKTVVRIRSDQKLPERVVYDTSLPTIVPPAAKRQVAAAPPARSPISPRRPGCATPLPSSFRRKPKKLEPQVKQQAQNREGSQGPSSPADALCAAAAALRLFRRPDLEQHLVRLCDA